MNMELPAIFPIFPLDGVILVPGTLLPLHIFEDRYRQMVADVVASEQKCFAMAMPARGYSTRSHHEPPVHSVCGIGRVIQHQLLEDGTSNIVLQGLSKMKILEELETDQPYRVVEGAKFSDVYPEGDDLKHELRSIIQIFDQGDSDDHKVLDALPAGQLIDVVLMRLGIPGEVKQELFAEPDVRVRIRELKHILAGMPGQRRERRSFEIGEGDPRLN